MFVLWCFTFISTFSRRVLHLLSCTPIIITRLVKTVLPPRRYGVMRGVCLVELSFPGGGTRIPIHLPGDIIAYKSSPWEDFTALTGGASSPLPHLVTGLTSWYMEAPNY